MGKIKIKEIAILAIKSDLKKDPDRKVYCLHERVVLTHREILERLEKGEKWAYDQFVKPFERLLKRNKELRLTVMKQLGLA